MPPATRADFEVAIICALPLEASAVLDLFDEHYDDDRDIYGRQEGDSNAYSTGRIGHHDIVLAHMPGMGKSSAASVASGLRSSFPGVRLALIVGICGAVPIPSPDKPIILGDVVISNSVIEFDFGRQYPNHFERKGETKDTLGRPNTAIRAVLSKLQVRHVRERLTDKTMQNLETLREKNNAARYPGANQDRLFADTHRHMHHMDISLRACLCVLCCSSSDPVCEEALESSCHVLGCHTLAALENPARRKRLDAETPTPLIHIGTIGSASTVMKSGEHRDRIAQEHSIIAFEMEGAGVWDNLPCIIIKGVCDYADSHKSKEWQEYAAATAASATKAFLDYWTPRQGSTAPTQSLSKKRPYSPSSADDANASKKDRHRSTPEGQDHMSVSIRTAQASTSLQSVSLGTRQTRLDALNFEQLDARHATIKKTHTGTCKWLFSKSEYLDWQDEQKLPEHNGFLWIKGKPGAGKSALMKFAYSEAQAKSKDEAVISYFFNARGERLEKSTCGMYRSLLFQLLSKLPRLQVVLDGSSEMNDTTSSTEALQSLFRQAVEKLDSTPLSCFIDALDECEENEDQVREMVNFFEELGEHAVENNVRLLVCFSSRHYPHITINKSVELILEVQQGHAEDITKYIQANLKADKSERLDKIRTKVQDKSQGIFLWVMLVVPMLQKAWNRGRLHAIEECLRSIPGDLNRLFKDILCRDTEDAEEVVLCLKWVLHALRPLRPEELYFGILSGTNSDLSTPWESRDVTPAVISRFILSSSRGLAEPTRTKVPTIQFIHESVRDFLLKENGLALLKESTNTVSTGSVHDLLKHCCQRYIDTAAKNQIPTRGAATKFPFLEYSIRHVFKHAELAASHMVSQELFLKHFALASWVSLQNVVEKHRIRRYSPLTSFLYILVEQSAIHLCQTAILWSQAVNTQGGRYDFPIIAAAVVGNEEILELLLLHGADINAKGMEYDNALYAAIHRCDSSTTKFLISHGAVVESNHQAIWTTLLDRAIKKQSITKVEYLLTSQPTDVAKLTGDTLSKVMRSGDTGMLELILSLSHDPRRYRIAVTAALEVRDEATALMVLERGADVSAHYYGEAALHTASGAGYEAIVRVLLEKGADVDALDANHISALIAASSNGHGSIVRMLLDHGADVNARNPYDFTALQGASQGGYEDIVRMLLDHDGIVNGSRTNYYGVALYSASFSGHGTIIRMLLDHGDIIGESQMDYYGVALETASALGHEAIVRTLLDHGADANKEKVRSAFHLACSRDHATIVRMLLDQGANVNDLDFMGCTPLDIAMGSGHQTVVRVLLDYGVDIDVSSGMFTNALAAANACPREQERDVCRQMLLEEDRRRGEGP